MSAIHLDLLTPVETMRLSERLSESPQCTLIRQAALALLTIAVFDQMPLC